MISLKYVQVLPLQAFDRTKRRQSLLEQMSILSSEKSNLEEQLKESQYVRSNYRRDYEKCNSELATLKNSVVGQTKDKDQDHQC